MHYGARAKNWIVDHDVRQKKLADEFHVTPAMLSNYLNGRNEITVDILVKIAQYFHISMDYLVGLTDRPEPSMELSREERELVARFRTLRPDQREVAVKTVIFMSDQNQRK